MCHESSTNAPQRGCEAKQVPPSNRQLPVAKEHSSFGDSAYFETSAQVNCRAERRAKRRWGLPRLIVSDSLVADQHPLGRRVTFSLVRGSHTRYSSVGVEALDFDDGSCHLQRVGAGEPRERIIRFMSIDFEERHVVTSRIRNDTLGTLPAPVRNDRSVRVYTGI